MKTKTNYLLDLLKGDADRTINCFDFKELKDKTILLTGASGLIGVNILSTIKEISKSISGITIIPIIQSNPPDFLIPFLTLHGVNAYQGNLIDECFINTLPKADFIIHAAGYGQPNRFMRDPLVALKLNTLTTFKLLDKLNEDGKFLFLSSSEVYTGLQSDKFSEDQIGTTNTFYPRAGYIEGKRVGETICNLSQSNGITTYSIRLSLTFGPGLKKGDQRVLPSFIEKGLEGKIELLDSGNASRTFCYVSDAIEMMWYILLGGKKNLYNVGGNSRITIKELAFNIGTKLNVPVILPTNEKSILGAPNDVYLDLSRLLSEYPKTTFVSLDEGLNRTIDWYKHLS